MCCDGNRSQHSCPAQAVQGCICPVFLYGVFRCVDSRGAYTLPATQSYTLADGVRIDTRYVLMSLGA